VIVSVPSPARPGAAAIAAAAAAAGGAPNRGSGGGWPAGGSGTAGGCGGSTEVVCRGSGKGGRGGAGNGTVLKRGTGAAAVDVTQLLSDVCTTATTLPGRQRHAKYVCIQRCCGPAAAPPED